MTQGDAAGGHFVLRGVRGRLRPLLVVAFVGTLAVSATAAAHTDLKATTPTDGARLASAPSRVVVIYSEPLGEVVETSVSLDGRPLAGGTADRLSPTDAGRLQIPISAPGAFGRFAVSWRARSADGHTPEGELAFTVAPPSFRETLRRVAVVIATAARRLQSATS